MKIWCTGIVHYPDKVVLVRDNDKQSWRLPERELDETEDIILCIRRTVLTQTGYRAAKIRFYKIQTQAKTAKQGAFIRFIFGCEVAGGPIQSPDTQAQGFTPDEIIKLASQEKFNDKLLLDLVTRYRALAVTPPAEHNPLPIPN